MLGHRIVTPQTGASGAPCSELMVCERRYSRRELYVALLLNRTVGGPAIVASSQGITSRTSVTTSVVSRVL